MTSFRYKFKLLKVDLKILGCKKKKSSTSQASFFTAKPPRNSYFKNIAWFQIKEPRLNRNPFCTNAHHVPQSIDYLKEIPFNSGLLILQIEYKKFYAIGIKKSYMTVML